MKLKTLILSFSLYLSLFSCHHKLEIPNSPSSETVKRIEEAEETSAQINIKYLDLFDIVERLRIYTEEENSQWDPTQVKMEPAARENYAKKMDEYLAKRIQAVDELYESTSKLVYSKISIDNYLYDLLLKRMSQLIGRRWLTKIYLSRHRVKTTEADYFLVPTSERLFEWLTQDHSLVKYKAPNAKNRIDAIQKFQLYNLLIKKAFKTCSLNELTSPTIDLLRMSAQLHPLLEGSSQNLGHPDNAGSDYAVLEALIFHPSEESYKDDFTSSLFNLLPNDLKLKCTGLCKLRSYILTLKVLAKYIAKIDDNDIHATQEDFPLNNQVVAFVNNTPARNLNKLKEKILKVRQELDLEIFLNHRTENWDRCAADLKDQCKVNLENILPVLNLNQPNNACYPLPCPNFLKSVPAPTSYTASPLPKQLKQRKKRSKKRKKKKNAQLELNISAHKNILENAKATSSTTQGDTWLVSLTTDISHINLTNKPAQNLSQAPPQASETIIPSNILTDKPDLKANLDMALQEKEGNNEASQIFTYEKEKEKEKEYESEVYIDNDLRLQQASFTETIARIWSFEIDWILPRGLRAFHNNMLPSPYQGHKSLHHQDIVNKIFNSEQKCSVTFKEFKTLWISEGGEMGNSGGSHKELIGPALSTTLKGKTLFGIFAHGNNQTYGKEYIKYLQTAILYIGLRPDDFIME